MRSKYKLGAGLILTLAVLATGAAISAQDKYTLKVPNGLAFSEFKGYEDWHVISISRNGDALAVIVGNPAMIDAYKAGVPGNGEDPLEREKERHHTRSAVSGRCPA